MCNLMRGVCWGPVRCGLVLGLMSVWACPLRAQAPSAAAPPTEQAEQGSGGANADGATEATTAADPLIPLDQLQILVKPLSQEELTVEAAAWFELLRAKAGQIAAVQLSIKKANEALAETDLENGQAALRAAQAALDGAGQGADPGADPAPADAPDPSGTTESDAGTAGNAQAASEPPESTEGVAAAAEQQKAAMLTRLTELQEERTAILDRMEVVLVSLESKGGEVQSYRDYMLAVSGIELDTRDAGAAWVAITGWLASKEGGQRWLWNFVLFLLILLITLIAAKVIAGTVNWLLERKVELSQLSENLISRTIKNVVLLVGFAISLTALEVDITPIIAAIGAAGFIVGFALQGTLSNFASGLMILVNRPFDVGDVVTAGGVTGVVHEMNLVATTFRTFDNQTIHVPNNEIWGSVITNITANDTRRVDLEFGIGYGDDFERAEQIIREAVEQHELVLKDPPPEVVTHHLGDSSVGIVCRPWAKTSDWWTVKTDLTRQVKKRLDEAGISIPFPQRDVHLYQH